MLTNYAAPVATFTQDTSVPVGEWETLLMVWTLRSLRPEVDLLTTLSWSIQFNGSQYLVVERVDGNVPADHMSRAFDTKDEALDFFGEMVRCATPPCAQGALPGMVVAAATYIETYAYYQGFNGAPCTQSHARVGGWN